MPMGSNSVQRNNGGLFDIAINVNGNGDWGIYLATREHVTKGLRELMQIERGQLVRISQHLQEVLTAIQGTKKKHQPFSQES